MRDADVFSFPEVLLRRGLCFFLTAMLFFLEKKLPAGNARFAVDWLHWLEYDGAEICGSGDTSSLTFDAGHASLHKVALATYPDDEDGDNWHFADMPVDSHVDDLLDPR